MRVGTSVMSAKRNSHRRVASLTHVHVHVDPIKSDNGLIMARKREFRQIEMCLCVCVCAVGSEARRLFAPLIAIN